MANIFENKTVVIFVSLLWGLGLTILFRKICTNDQCVIVKVPHNFIDTGNIIQDKNKCYKLIKYNSQCVY